MSEIAARYVGRRWNGPPLRERVLARIPAGDPSQCWVWLGYKRPDGYGTFRFRGKNLYAHRLAYEALVGPIPTDLYLDHACHNTSCVNPTHLRPVTPKQNSENQGGLLRNNTSGYRGVTFHRATGLWQVQVEHEGQKHVSYHGSAEEAGVAARAIRNRLFTHNDMDRVG